MPKWYNEAQLEVITDYLCDNFDEVQEMYGFSLRYNGRYWQGKCPIHDGDNARAFTFYPEGHTRRGFYKCLTHQCHKYFQSTAIGLVRGILSRVELGWENYNSPSYGFTQIVDRILADFKLDVKSIKEDTIKVEKKQFNRLIDRFTPLTKPQGLTREQVRQKIQPPSPYFLDRGFPAALLDEYDVGRCTNQSKQMRGRSIIPLYQSRVMVGCLGRYEGKDDDIPRYLDWGNCKNALYGMDDAASLIRETQTAIICEGAVDRLRLVQAGYRNSVALLGAEMSDSQQIQLEQSNCMKVILALDMDEAGQRGSENIENRLKKLYKVTKVKLEEKDCGDCSVNQLQGTFGSLPQ
jgi:5S rRNA maturation endonuclease (ribonuclease M5)